MAPLSRWWLEQWAPPQSPVRAPPAGGGSRQSGGVVPLPWGSGQPPPPTRYPLKPALSLRVPPSSLPGFFFCNRGCHRPPGEGKGEGPGVCPARGCSLVRLGVVGGGGPGRPLVLTDEACGGRGQPSLLPVPAVGYHRCLGTPLPGRRHPPSRHPPHLPCSTFDATTSPASPTLSLEAVRRPPWGGEAGYPSLGLATGAPPACVDG